MPNTLAEAQSLLGAMVWKDGAETAGAVARQVKHNLQADLSTSAGTKLKGLLNTTIRHHQVLRAAAQPFRFSKLLISRTDAGGGYGTHIDNAYIGAGADRVRTDMSFTLFLSDPHSYEGGALVIEHAGATQSVKLPAGALILYPATTLHHVQTVSSGKRFVCVGWIESLVKDPVLRETLFDLTNLKAELAKTLDPQSAEMLILSKAIANLTRSAGR